jgi:hypothetical protein
MWSVRSFLVVSIAIVPATAFANCEMHLGTTAAARDIDEVMKPFLEIGPKGEFESSAEYNRRQQTAITALPEELLIAKEPEGRQEYIKYDAEAQRLNITRFAFRNLGLPSGALFDPDAPYEGLVDYGFNNLEVVIKYDEVPRGRYSASNAYGATINVSRIFERYWGVFERKEAYPDYGLFPDAEDRPYLVASILMPPQIAQNEKEVIRFAYVIRPKAPYFATVVDNTPSTPSIDYPFEKTKEVSVLIADIRCGLVLDSAGKVIAAFSTN